jgi:hypothetical protein
MGLDSPAPRTMIPNSVSTPMILRNATQRTLPPERRDASTRNGIVSPPLVSGPAPRRDPQAIDTGHTRSNGAGSVPAGPLPGRQR